MLNIFRCSNVKYFWGKNQPRQPEILEGGKIENAKRKKSKMQNERENLKMQNREKNICEKCEKNAK